MKKLTKLDESQFWQLVGLLALAEKSYKQIQFIEEAIADTLGIKGEYGYYGHISDMVWNGKADAEGLLKKEGIEQP